MWPLLKAEIRYDFKIILIFSGLFVLLAVSYYHLILGIDSSPDFHVLPWFCWIQFMMVTFFVDIDKISQKTPDDPRQRRFMQRRQLLPINASHAGTVRLLRQTAIYLVIIISFIVWIMFDYESDRPYNTTIMVLGMTAMVLNGVPLKYIFYDLITIRIPRAPRKGEIVLYVLPLFILIMPLILLIALGTGFIPNDPGDTDMFSIFRIFMDVSRWPFLLPVVLFTGVLLCLLSTRTYRLRRTYNTNM